MIVVQALQDFNNDLVSESGLCPHVKGKSSGVQCKNNTAQFALAELRGVA